MGLIGAIATPLGAQADAPPDPRFAGAAQARLDPSYAVVLFDTGRRAMFPLKDLSEADKTWLAALAGQHPLRHGSSSVVVAAATEPVKKTVEISKIEGGVETVQLCQPNVIRTQDGPFCALFAEVHCLDIAGFAIKPGTIEPIQAHANAINVENPWADPQYYRSLMQVLTSAAPEKSIHAFNHQMSTMDWMRAELRKGRPVDVVLPEDIWQALPPEFIAAIRRWSGGNVGHAVVVNGFTYNPTTGKGSFHIINSWDMLQQFDLTTDQAKDFVQVQFSISPRGERVAEAQKETIVSVVLVGTSGQTKLYKVQTNLGVHRVAAPNEDEARAMVENP